MEHKDQVERVEQIVEATDGKGESTPDVCSDGVGCSFTGCSSSGSSSGNVAKVNKLVPLDLASLFYELPRIPDETRVYCRVGEREKIFSAYGDYGHRLTTIVKDIKQRIKPVSVFYAATKLYFYGGSMKAIVKSGNYAPKGIVAINDIVLNHDVAKMLRDDHRVVILAEKPSKVAASIAVADIGAQVDPATGVIVNVHGPVSVSNDADVSNVHGSDTNTAGEC